MATLINACDQTIIQHNVLTGGANNTVSSVAPGANGNVLTSNGTDWTSAASSGGVTGPGSSTDRAIATWNGAGGTALFNNSSTKIDSTGRQTNSAQPAFFAYVSSVISNVTGDATAYQVAFDSTSLNVGSVFTTGAGAKFTAPVTGNYMFSYNVQVTGITAQTSALLTFTATSNSATTTFKIPTPFVAAGLESYSGSIFMPMTAADTASLTLQLGGGTKTVSVTGAALGSTSTYFSGFLVC